MTHPPSRPDSGADGADVPAVARGGVLNLLGAAVAAVAGVLLVVVVSRTLPQDRAGVFFTLTSLFLLAEMVTRLGTGTGLVYFVARERSLGRPQLVRTYRRAAFVPVLASAVLVAAALALTSPWITELVGGDDEAGAAVLLLAAVLPVAALSDTLLTATRGYSRMRPTVALDRVLRPVLQIALVTVAAGGSLVVLTGAWALPWVASAVLAWWWLRRLDRSFLPASTAPAPAAEHWQAFWRFTGPRAVTSVVQVALQRLDIILVAALIGPAAAAVYTAATRFLVVGQLSGTAITTAAQPRLAGLLAVDDRSATKSVYRSATAWLVLLTWPVYLLSAVFADVVLAAFGRDYQSGRPVVVILALAMLVATSCGMVDTLLNMAGRTTWTLANSLAALAVMIVLDLVLVPRIGILGAALGWAAAILVNNLLPLAQLLVLLRLHPFGRATLSAAALALLCFGAAPLAARALAADDTVAVTAVVLLGTAAYAASVLRWPRALALPTLRSVRARPPRIPAPPPDARTPVGGSL